MLRVAIVGCGKIADSHAAQIRRIEGCQLVGVCDREELMARQFSERLHLKCYYSDLNKLLMEAKPDVVHITTPPQAHFELAWQCLSKGMHVYVEKPFTLNTADAEALFDLAGKQGCKIVAGHDDQFHHTARLLRQKVREGYLGGKPVHMESYYCYQIAEKGSYAKALLGDKEHWVRKLPGKLLHNIISHGIARLAEYLVSDSPRVIAHGLTSPLLRNMGENEIIDELRVIIVDADATAYFTFSSQMRPSLHQFRIYGPRNGLLLDMDNETLIQLPGQRYRSYAEHFLAPVGFAKQYAGNSIRNMRTFLANDFHMKSGLKYLTESFYRSIADDTPPPITPREIILTARIMDTIFEQVRTAPAR
jgi:predicted dehydrogenase